MMTFKNKKQDSKVLLSLTNIQLSEIAIKKGLKVNKKMVKADLIKLIEGEKNA